MVTVLGYNTLNVNQSSDVLTRNQINYIRRGVVAYNFIAIERSKELYVYNGSEFPEATKKTYISLLVEIQKGKNKVDSVEVIVGTTIRHAKMAVIKLEQYIKSNFGFDIEDVETIIEIEELQKI